jgi:hypothetical protein
MSRVTKTLVLALAAVILVFSPLLAVHEKEMVKQVEEQETAESPLSVSLETSVYNKSYGQGFLNYDNMTLQNEVSIGISGFGITIWTETDLKQSALYEADLYLDYTLTADILEITLGYNWYTVLIGEGSGKSTEVFLDFSADALLQPAVSIAVDIDANPGIYSWLGIGHTLELYGTELSAGAAVEFSFNYWVTGMRLSTAVFSLEDAVPVGDYLTITPKVAYNLSLDRDNYENALVYGLTVSAGF